MRIPERFRMRALRGDQRPVVVRLTPAEQSVLYLDDSGVCGEAYPSLTRVDGAKREFRLVAADAAVLLDDANERGGPTGNGMDHTPAERRAARGAAAKIIGALEKLDD